MLRPAGRVTSPTKEKSPKIRVGRPRAPCRLIGDCVQSRSARQLCIVCTPPSAGAALQLLRKTTQRGALPLMLRAVFLTAGATAEKGEQCIVALAPNKAVLAHSLSAGIPKGCPLWGIFGDFLCKQKVTRSGERNSPVAKRSGIRRFFFAFSQQSFAPAGKSAKRRRWRKQRADFEEAAGELPANAGKATPAATVGSPQAKESLRFLSRASRLRGSRHPR